MTDEKKKAAQRDASVYRQATDENLPTPQDPMDDHGGGGDADSDVTGDGPSGGAPSGGTDSPSTGVDGAGGSGGAE
jgi:hypothetical protein